MRFYFHQRIDGDLLEDPDGQDFATADAACVSALVSAKRLWAAAIIDGEDLSGQSIEIVDAAGRRVGIVPLTDALPFALGSLARDCPVA